MGRGGGTMYRDRWVDSLHVPLLDENLARFGAQRLHLLFLDDLALLQLLDLPVQVAKVRHGCRQNRCRARALFGIQAIDSAFRKGTSLRTMNWGKSKYRKDAANLKKQQQKSRSQKGGIFAKTWCDSSVTSQSSDSPRTMHILSQASTVKQMHLHTLYNGKGAPHDWGVKVFLFCVLFNLFKTARQRRRTIQRENTLLSFSHFGKFILWNTNAKINAGGTDRRQFARFAFFWRSHMEWFTIIWLPRTHM